MFTKSGFQRYALATVLIWVVAGAHAQLSRSSAADGSLLSGKVVSSTGDGLAGVPVRAHREHSNVTVNVYTQRAWRVRLPRMVRSVARSVFRRHRASRFRARHTAGHAAGRQDGAARLDAAAAAAVNRRRDSG